VRLALLTASVLALLGGAVASAQPQPAPPGTPNVLCTEKTFPGRDKPTTPGDYSYRPRSCTLAAFIRSGREQSTHLLAIKWDRWTAESALGTGEVPVIEEHLATGDQREGRERVTIRLSRPRPECGRIVFTRAYVKWFFGGFRYHYRLHPIPVIGRACP
jgi:hypothetical protein